MRVYYFPKLDKTEVIVRKKRLTVITESGEYSKEMISELKARGLVIEYEMTKSRKI